MSQDEHWPYRRITLSTETTLPRDALAQILLDAYADGCYVVSISTDYKKMGDTEFVLAQTVVVTEELLNGY